MEEDILKTRLEKVRELRERGIDLYPHRWQRTHSSVQALALGTPLTEGKTSEQPRIAGRLMQIREMGKASFAHILDNGTKLQLYLKKDLLGPEPYSFFVKDIHVGDFVGVEGPMFRTRTGEITLEVHTLTLLSKALRPLPEKWHGLKDTDQRYRKRYLDLIANPEARKRFVDRSLMISAIRRALDEMGFLEVETPVLLAQAGGATATPFETFHRALDRKLVLRIATELYLKRLIIGGFDRVYELGRIFRNEGIDTRHNPEFTMLEAYQAYSDYNGMAELFETVVCAAAKALGIESVDYRGENISLKPPFCRLDLPSAWKEHCGADIHDILEGKSFRRDALRALAERLGIGVSEDTPSAKIFERIFDEKILSRLKQPTFVMNYPTAITPLAKCVPGDECLVERFECFIGTEEVANAYTELNDPLDQRERFAEQARQKAGGHDEAELLDEDFVEALETGMPPTGGIGFGIDRLAMIMTGTPSIREVVLFPALKDEQGSSNEEESQEAPGTAAATP
ncbi:MAG: lysine--tRNA ligase [Elusimicrobiota bacterium]|jgi:lysyl-tRNA synthetase class 2